MYYILNLVMDGKLDEVALLLTYLPRGKSNPMQNPPIFLIILYISFEPVMQFKTYFWMYHILTKGQFLSKFLVTSSNRLGVTEFQRFLGKVYTYLIN